jgi:hypothetical protein
MGGAHIPQAAVPAGGMADSMQEVAQCRMARRTKDPLRDGLRAAKSDVAEQLRFGHAAMKRVVVTERFHVPRRLLVKVDSQPFCPEVVYLSRRWAAEAAHVVAVIRCARAKHFLHIRVVLVTHQSREQLEWGEVDLILRSR